MTPVGEPCMPKIVTPTTPAAADAGDLRRGRGAMPAASEPLIITREAQAAMPQDISAAGARHAQGRQSVMSAEDIEASKAPLMDHLIELRSRLIKALLAFGMPSSSASSSPSRSTTCWCGRSSGSPGPENSKFIYTALLEYFLTQLKLALFGAGFISFPIVADADLQVRRARPLQARARRVPAVSDRDAVLLRAGLDAGLFRGAADAGAVLARHAAGRRRRRPRRSSCCPRSANICR